MKTFFPRFDSWQGLFFNHHRLIICFTFIDKRHILERWQRVGFIALYVSYIILLAVQEMTK